MSELLAKRVRDADPSSGPAAKRNKKQDLLLPQMQNGTVEDALKRAEANYARSLSTYQSVIAGGAVYFAPDYFHAAVKETATKVEFAKLAKDTGEKYEKQEKKLGELEKAVREYEGRLRTQEDAANKFRSESQQRQSQRRDELSALKRSRTSEEDRLKGEIERLRQQLCFYSLLSNTEIKPEGANEYCLRVRLHQNEFAFRMRLLPDQTVDYELLNYTVSAARVPEVLTQAINIDQKDIPNLLLTVMNGLM